MKISQREARRLRRRVVELERAFQAQRQSYSQEYFGGTQVAYQDDCSQAVMSAVRTARVLGHAVVAIPDGAASVRFMALPHPKVGV